jgi:hypothetical protein
MVLALQLDDVYQKSISGVSSKKTLADERIARVFPTLVSTWCSVLPGFAPAGEALLFRQKAPKPVTPRLTSLERRDASLRRADQLAPLKQGPPADESVPPLGQTEGVGPGETNLSLTPMKERGTIYILYDPAFFDLCGTIE